MGDFERSCGAPATAAGGARAGLVNFLLLLLVLAGALVAAPARVAAAPGYRLEEELVKKSAAGGEERERTISWMVPGKMRKEQSPGGSVTIIRDDRALLWVLDPVRKTYFELDSAAVTGMGEAGLALLGGEDGPPERWARRTGNRRQIGAWQAEEVLIEDRPIPGVRISLWLSKDVPIDPALRKSFGSGVFAGASPTARLLSALRDLEGHPVEVELRMKIGGQVLEMRQTLTRVEKVEVADDRFELPAGLTRVASPLEPGAGARRAAPSPPPLPSSSPAAPAR